MAPRNRPNDVLEDLLCQALETEMGGVLIYRTALACARNTDLKEEWKKYGAQTQRHVQILQGVFRELDLDPQKQTPGRRIVAEKGKTLLAAMDMALKYAPGTAQIVAAECVVDAETKDHQNWELLGQAAGAFEGSQRDVLRRAVDEVEDEEDEHLYHTQGWARELWLESLGLPAQLPPPEEEKDVKTMKEAAQAREERKPGRQKADAGDSPAGEPRVRRPAPKTSAKGGSRR